MDDLNDLKIEIIYTPEDMQAAMGIRVTVFVQEQNVPEEIECDQFEKESTHLIGKFNDKAVATLRFRQTSKGIKIERVAVIKEYRRLKIGEKIMDFAENIANKKYPNQQIYLHSQRSAVAFYQRAGYKIEGEMFIQAGIEHFLMKKEGPCPSC